MDNNNTDQNRTEPLPQRWALILTAGCVAGIAAFSLGAPALAVGGAVGAAILWLHRIMA
ncbi:hypothetical protein ABT236_38250 [Streptomyces sp. NPDC001523]|uniref:hypothetical protein n=1 Tax=Streptomyces sp. NPDC001523 TaxID=3154383 RepID=UPI00333322B5